MTGTGSGGYYWVMLDAGAHCMLDFTDVGLASTYRQPMQVIERTFVRLLDHLTDSGAGVNLVEVADGIYQRETSQLIESDAFRDTIDVVLFAAGDAMGAAAGVSHLRSIGLDVVAVSDRLTRSPLATREAAAATGLPVLTIRELSDPAAVSGLLGLDASRLTLPSQQVPVSSGTPRAAVNQAAARAEAVGVLVPPARLADLSIVPEQRSVVFEDDDDRAEEPDELVSEAWHAQ